MRDDEFFVKGFEHLTKAQRCRVKELSLSVDKVTQADRHFFERFPHRQHRIRLASRAEVEQHQIILGINPNIPPGYNHYIAVKNVLPGARMRLQFAAPEELDTDLPEETARSIYESLRTPQIEENERYAQQLYGE